MVKFRRILIRTVLSLLVCLMAMAAAIHVQQRVLRSRAQLLLEDIRKLELRKSNWGDAQRVFARWGAWGHYDGACGLSGCKYRIVLENTSSKHPKLTEWVHRTYG